MGSFFSVGFTAIHLDASKTDDTKVCVAGSVVRLFHVPTLSHKPRYKRDEMMTHCLASLLSIMQRVLVVQVWHSDRVVK